MAILEISTVIEIILGMTSEAIAKNLNRSETVLRALRQLGIDKEPATNDFDTIYAYSIVEYGIFKRESLLNLFRHQFIREAFRNAFYENKPDILQREVDDMLDWKREAGELGIISADLHRELDEFKNIFGRIVNISRTPSEVEHIHKIDNLHKVVSDIQKRVSALANESSVAQQIARDKPELWEFLLTLELLRSKLEPIRRDFDDLRRGLIYRPSKKLEGLQYLAWLQAKMEDLSVLIHLLNVTIAEEFRAAWGKLGESGDVAEIQRATDKIAAGSAGLLDWEIDLRYTMVPEEASYLKQLLEGWTEPYLREIERIPTEIGRIVSQPGISGTHYIDIVFEEPANVGEVLAEIEKLRMILTGSNL